MRILPSRSITAATTSTGSVMRRPSVLAGARLAKALCAARTAGQGPSRAARTVGCWSAMGWLETYRGTVNRWEVDNVDHFTVAYYFERFEDATLALRHALGLDPVSLARAGCACASKEFHVRYLRELRIGDILHIRSGVIAIVAAGLVPGHRVLASGAGALCTTAALRMALIDGRRRAPVPLPPDQRGAAESLLIEWDPPAPATAVTLPEAGNDNGFLDTSRDAIKPWEADALGEADFPAYIHRFSAAN